MHVLCWIDNLKAAWTLSQKSSSTNADEIVATRVDLIKHRLPNLTCIVIPLNRLPCPCLVSQEYSTSKNPHTSSELYFSTLLFFHSFTERYWANLLQWNHHNVQQHRPWSEAFASRFLALLSLCLNCNTAQSKPFKFQR